MRIATLVVALLAGCATPGAELAEATGSWDGATYDEVVLRWGAPARSTKLTDGRDVYTWVSDSAGSRGSSAVGFGIGGGGGGGIRIGHGAKFGTGGGAPGRRSGTQIFKGGTVREADPPGPGHDCRSFAPLAPQ